MTLALLIFGAIVLAVNLKAKPAGEESGDAGKSVPQSAALLKPRKVWNAKELSMYQRLSEALPDHIILAEVCYQAFITAMSNLRYRARLDRYLANGIVGMI